MSTPRRIVSCRNKHPERLRMPAIVVERGVLQAAGPADYLDEFRQAVPADHLLDLCLQAGSLPVEVLDHALVLIGPHGRDRRRQRVSLRAMRGREQEDARPVVVIEPAQAHELAPAA